MDSLHPWLAPQWPRFFSAGPSFHQGLVLSGTSGIGKREFAAALAQRLLCPEPGEYPCGQCRDCRLFLAGSHPDIHVLITEQERETGRVALFSAYAARYPDRPGREGRSGPSKVISVDKIRLLIDRFYRSSHSASGRVALLLPSDRMNANAANALLKLLEEPPPGSRLVLVTDRPGSLLPTIRSRCVVETLAGPSAEASLEWLRSRTDGDDPMVRNAVSSGLGPLDILADLESGALALQAANLEQIRALCTGQGDPVALAESLAKQDPLPLLGWLQRFTGQLIRWQTAGGEAPWGPPGPGGPGGPRIPPGALFALYDKIGTYRRIARDQLNLRLALEEILVSLGDAAAPVD